MSLGNPGDFNGDGRVDYVDQKIFNAYINPNSGEYQGNKASSSGGSGGGVLLALAVIAILFIAMPAVGVASLIVGIIVLIKYQTSRGESDTAKSTEKSSVDAGSVSSRQVVSQPLSSENKKQPLELPASVYNIRNSKVEKLIQENRGKVFHTKSGTEFSYKFSNKEMQLLNKNGKGIGNIHRGIFIHALNLKYTTAEQYSKHGFRYAPFILAMVSDARFASPDVINTKQNGEISKTAKSVSPKRDTSEIRSSRSKKNSVQLPASVYNIRNSKVEKLIQDNEGKVFHTKSGTEFSYSISDKEMQLRNKSGKCLAKIHRGVFIHALNLKYTSIEEYKENGFPASNYLFAMVNDARFDS